MDKKQIVCNLLRNVNRAGLGTELLIDCLHIENFFTIPASTKYHGAYEGGLLNHSLSVFYLFRKLNKKFHIGLDKDSVILCSLLHDICKIGAYNKSRSGYVWNPNQPVGHATLSLTRISGFIELTDQEIEIIKYHMGMYGTIEFSPRGEYKLQELVDVYNRNKAAKLFHMCDDMSTQYIEDVEDVKND